MELEPDREDTCELNKEFFDILSFSSAAFWLAVTLADNKNSRYGFICNVWSLLTELFDVDLTLLKTEIQGIFFISSFLSQKISKRNDADTGIKIWNIKSILSEEVKIISFKLRSGLAVGGRKNRF